VPPPHGRAPTAPAGVGSAGGGGARPPLERPVHRRPGAREQLGEPRARGAPALVAAVTRELARRKWFLWHGNVVRALQITEDLEVDLDGEGPTSSGGGGRRPAAGREFGGAVRANVASLPNGGARSRAGDAISSAVVGSTVNQVTGKRLVEQWRRRWAPRRADLVLQVRPGG